MPLPSRVALVLACALIGARAPAQSIEPGPSTPALEAIASLETVGPIAWNIATDTGLLVAYADGSLHILDLLDGGKRVGEPIPLPGAARRGGAVPVSGTNLLIITSAGVEPDRHSRVIHLMTGRVLWEGEVLRPPVETFLFPTDGVLVVRSGRAGDRFAAFDLATGRSLWSRALRARYAARRTGLLEVLGGDSGLIDPVSGQFREAFHLPAEGRYRVLPLPSRDHVVLWEKNDFRGFAVPAASVHDGNTMDTDADPAAVLKPIWRFEAESSMSSVCVAIGTCWVEALAGDRLLVGSKHHVEMVDATSGEVVWVRRKNTRWTALPVSPAGKTGVELDRGELVFIDMKTGRDSFRLGAPAPAGGKAASRSIRWLDESELLIVDQDSSGRPRGMTRYDIAGQHAHWSRPLPEPAHYRLTAKQKGIIVGGVFAAVALTAAVVAAAPAVPAFYPTTPIIVPPIPFPAAGPPVTNVPRDVAAAMEAEIAEAAAEWMTPPEILALERRRERWHRMREATAKTLFVVAGEDDVYRVIAVDLDSGNQQSISEYRREKVHAMNFDIASRLVISTEANARALRLLAPPP